jgi:hypothetical protein
LFNYIVDAYLFVAASALAATTVVRSIFAAVFPVRVASVKSMISNVNCEVSVVYDSDVCETWTAVGLRFGGFRRSGDDSHTLRLGQIWADAPSQVEVRTFSGTTQVEPTGVNGLHIYPCGERTSGERSSLQMSFCCYKRLKTSQNTSLDR